MSGQNNIIKGVIFVGLGAAMYGMLATFVKLAYNDGYTTAEVTSSQFTIGLVILFLINRFRKSGIKNRPSVLLKTDKRKLIFAGTSYGFTSLFYYLSVQYINVSIAIVLLMQSVWLSVVLEAFLNKEYPNIRKITATLIVLGGTLMATNTINAEINLDVRGILWGMAAAVSYTVTMFTANKIANYTAPTIKSFYMLIGGAIIIYSFLFISQIGPSYIEAINDLYSGLSGKPVEIRPYNWRIFYSYGLFLALFGTVLPPIFLNKGFPDAGLGVGSIVSSIELPVSVTMALVLLNEQVIMVQWLGIALILGAIVLMNVVVKRK